MPGHGVQVVEGGWAAARPGRHDDLALRPPASRTPASSECCLTVTVNSAVTATQDSPEKR
jgi:hypothetical protein